MNSTLILSNASNRIVALVFLVIFLSQSIFSQQEYSMYVINTSWIDDKTIEFEVNIKGINQSFELTSYQCAFKFIQNDATAGDLLFAYIDGTSQLLNQPIFGTGVNQSDGHLELTFASLAGSDNISLDPILVGRFRLQSAESLSPVDTKIKWDFEGFVSTILTGSYFQDITVPTYHVNNTILDLTTEIVEIPNEYKLYQNYPNPFNPSTKIAFALPKEANVEMRIYNILGEVIKTLIDERISAGSHSVDFIAETLPGGLYFCNLKVDGKFVNTIKLILLK